jgi:hypothetical protein
MRNTMMWNTTAEMRDGGGLGMVGVWWGARMEARRVDRDGHPRTQQGRQRMLLHP